MSAYMKINLIAVIGVISLLSMVSVACAQQPPSNGRGGPPPEALEACNDLAEGDACSFTGRRDELLEGLCVASPRASETLSCLPDDAPKPRR